MNEGVGCKMVRTKPKLSTSTYQSKDWVRMRSSSSILKVTGLALRRSFSDYTFLKNAVELNRTDTRRGMVPGLSRHRNLRSKIWWFTEFCNSHYVSHFAAFFIVARTKISVAKSCSTFRIVVFLFPKSIGVQRKKSQHRVWKGLIIKEGEKKSYWRFGMQGQV